MDDATNFKPSPEIDTQTFRDQDVKGEDKVYVEHTEFSKSLEVLEKDHEEEKFEWREVVRG